jgi:peptidoglycan/xylan/chitin deacetylase (PgdA/CDA1 family)
LEVLNKFKVKGTFFQLSSLSPTYPHINKRLHDAGMELSHHSHSHADLSKSSVDLDKEIAQGFDVHQEAWTQQIGGEKSYPTWFRCPYGSCVNTKRARLLMGQKNMMHAFWNVDTRDWAEKNPKVTCQVAWDGMLAVRKGIVLFHDIQKATPEALDCLLGKVKQYNAGRVAADQFKFVRMSDVFTYVNKRDHSDFKAWPGYPKSAAPQDPWCRNASKTLHPEINGCF